MHLRPEQDGRGTRPEREIPDLAALDALTRAVGDDVSAQVRRDRSPVRLVVEAAVFQPRYAHVVVDIDQVGADGGRIGGDR
ncbi:MAG: hypothetical protein VX956_13615 [Gemmatimonadota bacterium]|nr:hypothetical protein [Gemmatimonadota bacterium]